MTDVDWHMGEDRAPESSSDRIEIELVRSLFDSVLPAVIMSVGFVVSGLLIVRGTGDALLLAIVAAGILLSVVRLVLTRHAAAVVRRGGIALRTAHRVERRFALSYLAFAGCLGLFVVRVFSLPPSDMHMLAMCLLVGYAAGVASTVGLRPRIAIPAMLLSVVPAIIACLMYDDAVYRTSGALMAAMLAGGINSLGGRHARVVAEIGSRISYSRLARRDDLTGLPNRLALREGFDRRMANGEGGRLFAAHCIDLNGFKPINDAHGHPMGDALLKAIGARIDAVTGASDIAARIGGDEFVVLQFGLAREEEAEAFARNLAAAIARPNVVRGRTLGVSACIGYAVASGRRELEQLLPLADRALYAGKQMHRAVTRYDPVMDDDDRRADAA